MAKQLKGILTLSLLLMFSSLLLGQEEAEWGLDIDAAKSKAKMEGKVVLLSFSGSDWCANCMRLDKVLFQSDEFASLAKEELVLVKADFPSRSKNKLSKEQTVKNEALAERYNTNGIFPTVLLLSSEGEVIGRLSHPKESAELYVSELKSFIK